MLNYSPFQVLLPEGYTCQGGRTETSVPVRRRSKNWGYSGG